MLHIVDKILRLHFFCFVFYPHISVKQIIDFGLLFSFSTDQLIRDFAIDLNFRLKSGRYLFSVHWIRPPYEEFTI